MNVHKSQKYIVKGARVKNLSLNSLIFQNNFFKFIPLLSLFLPLIV